MSSGNFLVWRPGIAVDGICKLNDLRGVPNNFEIHEGQSRLVDWPADASAAMDPNFPKDIGLADSLDGTGFVLLSNKVRALLEGRIGGRVEYLPIKVINHKGRVASEEHSILNPLEVVDCIDPIASEAEMDIILDDAIDSVARLVLREDVIPPGLNVFRLARWTSRIIIRRSLANELTNAGLTGLRFVEPAKYDGMT